MRGPVALRAEIFAGEDDAAPEDLLPDAVDRDARGQRIVGRDQPARQAEARRFRRRACGGSTASVPGCTSAPRSRQSPFTWMYVLGGVSFSSSTGA